MKKLTSLILTFIFFSSATDAQHYTGESFATVKAKGKGSLNVVYYEQPGLIQKMPDGSFKGVCVDILNDFVEYLDTQHSLKVSVNYLGEEKNFSHFLKGIQTTPNILGVTNTSITEDRKKVFKFTPPFMTTQLVLLTHQDAPTLSSLTDLSKTYAGFTAEVITGSTHVTQIKKIKKEYYPELLITYAPSSDRVIKNLSSNPRMFSILDFTEYVGVVRKNLPIKRQNIDFGNAEALGFIMSKQSDWGDQWNGFLTEEYRKSVHYKKIIADNLGSTFLSLIR